MKLNDEDIKLIIEHMGDEISKDIFAKRLMYSCTEDKFCFVIEGEKYAD